MKRIYKKNPLEVRENCGIFAVFGSELAPQLVYKGIFSLQHRGQEGAGIAISDGVKISSIKGQGLVSEVFSNNQDFLKTKAHIAIGHVRYSTTGSTRIQNIQPIIVELIDGIWAIAHNGNITNAKELRLSLEKKGSIFQTGVDSEILLHLIAQPEFSKKQNRLQLALNKLKGSYAFIIMTKNAIFAVRDPLGFKPLSLGKLNNAWILSSETCALNQINAEHIRDLEPGELLKISSKGIHSCIFKKNKKFSQCIFELVYFARPDSIVFGESVHEVRKKYGILLAKQAPANADIVTPIPDSGNSAALGYSQASSIPLDYAFIRNHYIGRTFILPDQNQRGESADMKLSLQKDLVKGKRIIVIDDSLIRGTTARKRIEALRNAGAKEVHLRIASPPVKFPCFFGIDFPTKKELIATSKNIEQIRKFIGADSLEYLSIENLLAPVKEPQHFCTACFSGKYPLKITSRISKKSLEKFQSENLNKEKKL